MTAHYWDHRTRLIPLAMLRVLGEVRRDAEALAECEEFPDDLCGLCARASAEAHRRLKALGYLTQFGIATDIDDNESHVFLIWGNLALDITATQFGLTSPIQIAPLGATPFWTPARVIRTLRGLLMHQRAWCWPSDQSAQLRSF